MNLMKLIYSDKYLDYSFGVNHPFWPERAEQFLKMLKSKSKFKFQMIDAPRARDEDILLAHTREYLERVKKLANTGGRLSMDTPVTEENLEAAYYYVGGTIKAAELALKGEKVVNLLGGLHHAESNESSGFCIFNDHAIAIKKIQQRFNQVPPLRVRGVQEVLEIDNNLSQSPLTLRGGGEAIKTAAVLDLDVHAGNGTQEIFYDDSTVLTVSIHQDPSNFYPGTGFPWQKGEGEGKGFNKNYVLASGAGEKEYLPILDEAIQEVLNFEPDLVLIIFGVDTYKDDPLASLKLEKETYGKIAKKLRVFDRKAILFAGGYSEEVPRLWFSFVSNL